MSATLLGYDEPIEERSRAVPDKRANVKNDEQYEALKDKAISEERAAKIANAPDTSKHGGRKSRSGGDNAQDGTAAQKKKAGRKGGKASHS
jgi:hypothetical protein